MRTLSPIFDPVMFFTETGTAMHPFGTVNGLSLRPKTRSYFSGIVVI